MRRRCCTIAILTAFLVSACSVPGGKPADQSTGETTVTEAGTEPIRIESETESEAPSAPVESEENPSVQPSGADQTSETKTESKTKETQAAKVYSVTAFQKTMYATQPVHVRASYTMQSEVLTSIGTNQKVEVTGRSANGWMRIVYNGKDAYVYQKYLSESRSESGTSQTGENTAVKNPDGTTANVTNGNSTGGPTAGISGPTVGAGGSASGAGSSTTIPAGSATGPGGSPANGGGSQPSGTQPSGAQTSGAQSSYGPSAGQNSEQIQTIPSAPISGTSETLIPGSVSGPGVSLAGAVSGAAPGM